MNPSRESLWIAMSDLWLDTELSDAQVDAIADAVRESGLGRAELEDVFELELAPVLGGNHRAVAGEWAGFDPEMVCEQARRRVGRRAPLTRLLSRLMARLGVTTSAARPTWTKVLERAFDRP